MMTALVVILSVGVVGLAALLWGLAVAMGEMMTDLYGGPEGGEA